MPRYCGCNQMKYYSQFQRDRKICCFQENTPHSRASRGSTVCVISQNISIVWYVNGGGVQVSKCRSTSQYVNNPTRSGKADRRKNKEHVFRSSEQRNCP